uniref:RNA-directed DNA polymerase n=1 Tax=Monodelphis domestica TaxID=13616 RepID=A0A5F8GVR5_MONDO
MRCSFRFPIIAAESIVLKEKSELTWIPASFRFPVPQGAKGLILGDPDLIAKGLEIFPTLFQDKETNGLHILAAARPAFCISKDTNLVYLTIFPEADFSLKSKLQKSSLDSTAHGLFWSQKVTQDRMVMSLFVEDRVISGILDSGADISVISATDWPESWEVIEPHQKLIGIGTPEHILQSANTLSWSDSEGHRGILQLENLYDTLKGDAALSSPRTLSPKAGEELKVVEEAVSKARLYRIDPSLPLIASVLQTRYTPTGALHQDQHIIEWIHLANQQTKSLTSYLELIILLITQIRKRARQLTGIDPSTIHVPITREQVQNLFAQSLPWQIAFADYTGQIDNHIPANKILQFVKLTPIIFPRMTSMHPLVDAVNVFTDASKHGRAGAVVQDSTMLLDTTYGSPQKAELAAVRSVLRDVVQACNIIHTGQIDNHIPANKILQFVKLTPIIFPRMTSMHPLVDAVNVFTDASKHGRAGAVVQDSTMLLDTTYGSPQKAELAAVRSVLRDVVQACNIICDSLYVVNLVNSLETAKIKPVPDEELYLLFRTTQMVIWQRQNKFFITHIRSHTNLPGPLSEGNAKVDTLVASAFQDAVRSHSLLHQNAKSLKCQFDITKRQAQEIIQQCSSCAQFSSTPLPPGANPRGLKANQLWQMDVTQYAPFGRWKYVHVTIDTYSRVIWATAQTGKKVSHVIAHLLEAFAHLGIPSQIKTDNGTAYTSKRFAEFCKLWNINHKTGIPGNSTGQAIVERANRTLKNQIQKQKGEYLTIYEGDISKPKPIIPNKLLRMVLLTLNHFSIPEGLNATPMQTHFERHDTMDTVQQPWVFWRLPGDKDYRGPNRLITMGRGYACVSTDDGEIWTPSKHLKPWKGPLPDARGAEEQAHQSSTAPAARDQDEKQTSIAAVSSQLPDGQEQGTGIEGNTGECTHSEH